MQININYPNPPQIIYITLMQNVVEIEAVRVRHYLHLKIFIS